MEIDDLEYYPGVTNVLMHGYRPGQTIAATYLGQSEKNTEHKVKKLPDTCARYGISELELTGLMVNIVAFKTLLLHTDFEACVDHCVLVHIAKAKNEPKTLHIQ